MEPGGKWLFPKLILEENERTSLKDIEEKFPELIEILDKYPHVAKEIPVNIPWQTQKIPKEFALFQYSIEGNYIATHHMKHMTFITGMNSKLIKVAIERNQGFAYNFQWNLNKVNEMRNLLSIDQNEFSKMKNHDKPYKKFMNIMLMYPDAVKEYDNRIQEVGE